MLIKTVIGVFVCVCACSAHVCMLSPHQRTPLGNLNIAGNPNCLITTPLPCGNTLPSTDKVYLEGGSIFSVIFQKNVNYFCGKSPGYWSVSVAQTSKTAFKELIRFSDTDSPSLTMYSVNITIPLVNMTQPMIVQTQYVSNNPMAPKVFLQCADIMVLMARL